MNPHKDIEERFDKKFEGYWRGRSIPDEIKFFYRKEIEHAYAAGREDVWLGFQGFLSKYSIDRPIPPSELRAYLGEFGEAAKGDLVDKGN